MAVRVSQGFEVRSQEPIDSRIIAADETARLAINSSVSYNGLIVSQQNDDTLWLLIDDTDPSQASNWEEITGKVDSDGNTSAITESAADGKVISAITVNSDGLVTAASAKTLAEADIPSLAQSKITGLGTALDGKVDEPSGVTSQSILTWDGSNSSTVRLGALATMDSISVSNTTTYDYTDRSALNTLALALAELYDDDSRIHQQGDIAIVIWSDGTNNHTETLIYTGETQTTAASTLAADWTDISADVSGKVDVDSNASAETIAATAGSVLGSITVNSQGLVTDVASKTLAAGDIPTIAQSQVTDLTTDLDGKVDEDSATSAITHAATTGSVIDSITVNADGLVTAATQKALAAADIPTIAQSQVTDLSTDLDGKVDEDSNTSAITHAATAGSVIDSITVNADGLVTAATQKALVAGDIPTIAQSQVTDLTTDLDGKVDEDSNTSAITHAAATGEVIDSITVNADGLVTAATQKSLAEADIPTLAQSKITNLTTDLASKVDEDSNTSAITHAATTGEVIDSITVNADGLVTEATQKALAEADIPTLSQSKITNLTTDLASKVDEPSGVTTQRILTWDGTNSSTIRLGALASMDSLSVSNTTTYDYSSESTINTLALALAELYAETSRAHEQGDIAIVIWSDGTNSHTETLIFTGTSQTTAGTSTASDWTDISADLSGKVDVDSNAGSETIAAANGVVLGSITVNSQGLVTAVGSKTLAAADIPTIAQSQVTDLTTDLSGKVDTDSDASAVTISDSNTNFISNIAVNAQGLVTSVGVKAISADDLPDTGLGNIVNGSASNTNYDVPAGDIFWRSSDAVYWNTGSASARVEIDADGFITWPSPDPFQQLSHTNITVTRNTDGTLNVNSSNGTDDDIPFATATAAGIVRLATSSGLDIDSGQVNLDVRNLPTTTTVDNSDTTAATADFLAVHTTVGGTSSTHRIDIPTFIDQIQGAIDLAGERITSGTVAADRIADLSTGKITSGRFGYDRLPTDVVQDSDIANFITASSTDTLTNKTIDASQLSGTIDDARIPSGITRDTEIANFITASSTDTLTNKTIDASQLSGTIDDARIPSGISRDSEFSSTSTSLTYPGGTFTPDVGEDNQTITTGDGVTGADSGESGDFTIDVNLADDSGLAFYSGELGASFQDEQISTTQAGRNLVARGNHNHDNRYLVQGALDHFEGTLDTKLETLIENLATNEGRVREKLYEHFEVADNVFSITAVPDGSGGTINEIAVDTTALPSGVSPLAQSGGTSTAPAGVILENDHNNQVYFQSHVDTFSTVARQGNNYADSTVIGDGLDAAFNNLADGDSAEYAIVVGYYTAGSGEWNENEALLFEVPVNAGNGGTQQVDWVCRSGILPVSAQFDEAFVFFFDGDPGFRTHAAGTVRISLTNSGQFENLASRFTSANSAGTTLNIAFTERDGTNHEETILTTSARPNFREWDHWGPYLDVGINNEATTVFEVEPGSYVSIYENQSITIHETPHRVNILDTDNTTGATELNWYAPTGSLATSTHVSSSTTELTIRSGSSSTLTANNRYFIRTGNDIGELDAGEWYSARYLRRSTNSGGTEDGYIFDTIRDVHGDSVTLTTGSEIETSLWEVEERSGVVTRGSGGGDITVQEEGTALITAATTLNFTGAGVTASGNGATKTIEIPGGGEIDNDATAVRAAIFRGRNDRRAVPRSNPFVRNVNSSNIIVSGTGDNVTWNLSGIPSADLTEANFPASSSLTEPDVFWGVNVTSSSNTAAVPLGLYHAYASDSPNNIIESTNEIRLVGAQPIDGTDYENPTAASSSCDYQIIRLTEIDEVSGGSTVNVQGSEVTDANFVDSGEVTFTAATNGDISATVNDNTIDGNELNVDYTSVSSGTPQFLRVSDTGALSLTSTTSTGISSLSIDTDEDGTAGTLTSSDGSFGIAGDGIVQTEVTGTDVVVSLNTSSFSNGDILSVDASGNIVAGTATTVESTENTFVLGGRAKRRNVDSGTTYVTSYVITDGGGSDLNIEVVTNSRARGSNTIQERRIGFNGVSFNQAILNVGFFHGLRTDTSIAASEIAQIAYIRGEVGYNNTGTAYTDTSVTPRPNADGDLELQGFTDALRLSAGLIRFRATASVGNFAANTDYTASMTRVSQTMTLTNIRDANGDSIAHGITSTSPSRSFTAQNIAVENEGYFGAIQGTAPYTYTNK